jgi:hypothetical protein
MKDIPAYYAAIPVRTKIPEPMMFPNPIINNYEKERVLVSFTSPFDFSVLSICLSKETIMG